MIHLWLRRATPLILVFALAGCPAAGGGQAPGPSAGGTGAAAGTGGAAGAGGRAGSGTGGTAALATGGAGTGGAGTGGTGTGANKGGAGAGDAGTGGPGTGGNQAGAGTGGASTGTGGASSDAGAQPADSGADRLGDSDTNNPGSGFSCTQFVGASPMMQWFRGGFLKHPGIDPGKWQLIWVAHHYTDAWAKAGDAAWNTALDDGHACAQNSGTPDRVVFYATQWSYTTAAPWEMDFSGIIENIKRKWPSVKRIELMLSTTAPGNVPCPAAGGKKNETIIPAFAFQAMDNMPAKYPGLVTALPHFEVPSCSDFIGNGTAPQYAPNENATSGPAVAEVAAMFGAYFAAHP